MRAPEEFEGEVEIEERRESLMAWIGGGIIDGIVLLMGVVRWFKMSW